MKIAIIGGRGLPSKSGMERVIEAITNRLRDEHDITVYCDSSYTPTDTQICGIRLIRIKSIKGKHTRALSLYLFSTIHALLACNYDLIHLHGIETCFVLPLLRLKYPVIATAHGALSRTQLGKWGRIASFLMRLTEFPYLYLSNISTSVSAVDVEYFLKKYKRRVTFIPNGIEPINEFDQTTVLAQLSNLGIMPKEYLIFAAQRIDPMKGCHLIIEAIQRCKIKIPLIIIGDINQVPEYGNSLQQKSKGYPISFIPTIENKDWLFSFLKLCKLFIFPSFTEGMSMMLLEVVSLGVPVICSDIPENVAVLKENTLYFRSGDVNDLAEKILWANTHIEEMNRKAHSARDYLKENASWDIIAQKYDENYKQFKR